MFESIAILTHRHGDEIRGSRYFLSPLVAAWENQGVTVRLSNGLNPVPGDVALLHVDMTVVEPGYLEMAARYPRTLNFRVTDISKRRISRHLLGPGDHYDGAVIVKTDANYGGFMEGWYRYKAGTEPAPPTDFARPWRRVSYLDSKNYPVFERLSDVPAGVWRNPGLVVEKFLPERTADGSYRIHTYLFFGDCEVSVWYVSPDPVIKFHNATDRGLDPAIPEALRAVRAEWGFDFGRFDYSVVDDEVIVFDMNRTPAVGESTRSVIPAGKWDEFAAALEGFA